MMQLRQTQRFKTWFDELRDLRARARIQARLDRLSLGNPGDVRPVGSGVSELRIDYGPGYRVYFIQCGENLIVLLAGGDKDTQAKDIAQAITLASEL
jgi:putative addiction module killer protein